MANLTKEDKAWMQSALQTPERDLAVAIIKELDPKGLTEADPDRIDEVTV